MIDVTALILTFNERENIERSLSALAWARQVLIVDSFSTDGTIDLAQRTHHKLRIVQRAFDSFAGQCNYGLTQVQTEWVLSLDADYILTADLITEIARLEPPVDVAGYSAQFRYCVFGRPLRTTIYPPRTVLYRVERAAYRDEGHGHRVAIRGAVRPLAGKIDHDDRKPLNRWIRSQHDYAVIEARHLLTASKKQMNRQDRLRRQIYFAPLVMFFYLLVVRRLILDGWPGWFYICQRTLAEILLSLRLLIEREHLESSD
jgi:glycosyltransferase involved in cell wall biosynthesis